MTTLLHGSAFSISMPLNKDGDGPASAEETVITKYLVWDQVCNEFCSCANEEDAQAIAGLINEYWSNRL